MDILLQSSELIAPPSQSSEVCPICLELFIKQPMDNKYWNKEATTLCNHLFHTHCLSNNNIEKCPLCRKDNCNYPKVLNLHIANTKLSKKYFIHVFDFSLKDMFARFSNDIYGQDFSDKFSTNMGLQKKKDWKFDKNTLQWELNEMVICEYVQKFVGVRNDLLSMPHKEFTHQYNFKYEQSLKYEKEISICVANFLEEDHKKNLKGYTNPVPLFPNFLGIKAFVLKTFDNGDILLQLYKPSQIHVGGLSLGGARFILLYTLDLSSEGFGDYEKNMLEKSYIYSFKMLSYDFHSLKYPVHLLQKQNNFIDLDQETSEQPKNYRIKIIKK